MQDQSIDQWWTEFEAESATETPQVATEQAPQFTNDELMELLGPDYEAALVPPPASPPAAEPTREPRHCCVTPFTHNPASYPALADIGGLTETQVVIHTEYPYRHFLVFDSYDHFASWANKQPLDQRCYHEVVRTDVRHMFIDVDAADIPRADWDTATARFVEAFKEVIFNQSGYNLNKCDMALVSSSGYSTLKQADKYSLHIRAVDYSASAASCLYLAQMIAQFLGEWGRYVDLGVYKSTQNVRCVGSTKLGDNRHSVILNPTDIGLNDTWIGSPAKYHIGPFGDPGEPAKGREFDITDISDQGIGRVLEIAGKDIEGYRFRHKKGNLLSFNKLPGDPPACPICHEVHHNDNALFIVVQGTKIKRGCNQDKSKPKQLIEIGDLAAGDVETAQKAPVPLEKPIQRVERLTRVKLTAHREPVKYKYEMHKTDIEKMTDYTFELTTSPIGKRWSTLVVKAAKGLGKTEALVRYIDQHHENSTIVALTHRETFAGELSRQLKGFTHYKHIQGKSIPLAQYRRLIVQMESLHKLTFDGLKGELLLILDESESIHRQLSSKLFKHFDQAFENFYTLITEANHVVALDAHISHMTLNLLGTREGPKQFIHNTYKPPGMKYLLTPDKDAWYAKLSDCLNAGKKIVVPTNSATEARTIEKWLNYEYPDKTVKLYTGATDRTTKMADIENISEAWKVDVLIYSPTITAGVSFKEKWFDMVFGFFRVGSSPAAECDQMLGRVRDLADHEGVLFIDMSSLECRLTREQIRAQVINSRVIACSKEWNLANLTFINKRDGEEWVREVKDQRYFEIWLSNEVVANHSRAGFARELICLLQQSGCVLETLVAPAVESPMKEIAEAKEQVIEAKHQAIVDAPEVDHEGDEYEKLRDKVEKTPEDEARLHADYLRRVYNIKKEDMTVDWCKRYDNPQTIGRYLAIDAVVGYRQPDIVNPEPTDPAELYKRRLAERKVIDEHNWKQFGGRPSDLDRAYHFEKHRIAHEFLVACGFDTLHDTSIILKDQLEANILARAEYFNSTFDHVRATFRTRGKKPDFHIGNLNSILGYINSVLTSQYDIRIGIESRSRNQRNNYMIFHNDLYQLAMRRPAPPVVDQ